MTDHKKRLLELSGQMNKEWINQELDWICGKLEINMVRFGLNFPSACSEVGQYRVKDNDDWTNGFWTGMLWIAYLHTGKTEFMETALKNVESFKQRIVAHKVLDHHDIGFLYSLSAVAGYRIMKHEELKDLVIAAADVLMMRFQEKGGFLQAWGALSQPGEYRLIIDSLLNLPLLYEASKISGSCRYAEAADIHYRNVLDHIIREDYSTYHTYYFDTETGKASHGATHQGFSDTSCWARGQSWAILGIPLNRRVGDKDLSQSLDGHIYHGVVDYFLEHLSNELIPYWDLAFTEEDHQPYDSSALAIAACGLLEAGLSGCYKDAVKLAEGMISVLGKNATSRNTGEEGILIHGVYAYGEGKGVDQANLWGDYYYMEALYRLKEVGWETFW